MGAPLKLVFDAANPAPEQKKTLNYKPAATSDYDLVKPEVRSARLLSMMQNAADRTAYDNPEDYYHFVPSNN